VSPAKDASLQVRIDAALLAEFRQYAEGSGTTMSRMVLSWIRGAVGGGVPPASIKQVLGGSGEGPAAGVAMAEAGSGESIQLMRRQVALLEQLVSIAGKPAIPDVTPAGGTAAMPVVLSEEVLAEAATEAIPAEPAAGTAEPVAAQPEPVVPAPATHEAEDLLAAERARQLADLERHLSEQAVANQQAIEAERVKAVEAAGHHTPADVAPVKEKKGDAVFAQQLKEAAAAARAEAGTGMGGQQDASAEGSVSDQGVAEPAVQEPAVLPQVTDDGVVDVVATPADPGDDDLLKRVEALEKQERLMEDWLAAIRDGGDPVAPPLPADASEQDWDAAASDCLEARGKKPLPELIAAVLRHWGRG